MVISVIPDIHGHLQALEALLNAMGPATAHRKIVQLGDFVDRGPASRACLEKLKSRQAANPENFIVLKGNHEAMLEDSSKGSGPLAAWMSNGGSATLKSYGKSFERLCRNKGGHLAWISKLPLSWQQEGLLFCHAGLGAKNASAKDPHGLLWDRPPLVKGRWKAVICGHSPTASGAVEHADGIFRCDLGLGHHSPKHLEYLELELKAGALLWKVKPA